MKISIDDLDEVVNHYTMAALWSSVDDDQTPLDDDRYENRLAIETQAQFRDDCEKFIRLVEHLNLAPYDRAMSCSLSAGVGHDLWLTRNGHGAGFWDRSDHPVVDTLTGYAHSMGEFSLYVGDDGLIYGN